MTVPYTKDWASLSKLNPEFEAILPAIGGFQLVTPGVTTLEGLRAFGKNQPPTPLWPEVLEEDIQIPVRDGSSNRARVYCPTATVNGGKPLAVFAFGGGYVSGQLETEEINCRTWVKKFGGVAVSIGYRLSPEYPWPGSHEDMYDAVNWIASNHQHLDADPSKGFILSGTSSGATTMMAITHLWRDEVLAPPLTGIFVSIPRSYHSLSGLPEKYVHRDISYEQNKDGPVFNETVSKFLGSFVKTDPLDPLSAPLLWPTGHKNLPPMYMVVAGADRWRDSGLLYEEVLREEAGVKTKLDIFGGLIHGFWGFFPAANFSKEYRKKVEEGLEWLVEQSRIVG
ncbi:alpha/beta-hydrolase [Stipitochalara longipes BDJ]|nr:alpha/beta-hydrolase [Stipitochalara longipes BDJ]